MTEPAKPKVLLADDEGHIRLMMKSVLQRMNCEIAGEAKNGQEAVELFRKAKPDITLLDINMPLKTGEEALKEIMAEFPGAFVIMLTSLSDSEVVEKCIEHGAANYILKDTPIKEIQTMIRDTWSEFKKGKQHG